MSHIVLRWTRCGSWGMSHTHVVLCMYIYIHVHTYRSIYMYTCMYTYIYICILIHIYTYVYMYIYIYTNKFCHSFKWVMSQTGMIQITTVAAWARLWVMSQVHESCCACIMCMYNVYVSVHMHKYIYAKLFTLHMKMSRVTYTCVNLQIGAVWRHTR